MTIKEDNLIELKKKLKEYNINQIKFTQHFEQQLLLREGNKEQIIYLLTNLDKLVYSYQEKNSFGEIIHCLHFKISNTRTIRLPITFKKKSLYILTYIMRHRTWQRMVKRKK